jgi:archaellum component FlaF (FlaF/FlaG flagellin family)
MTIKNTTLSLLGLITLGSCATMLTSRDKMTTRTNKTATINVPPIISYPLVVDLDIDLTKKAKGTASGIISLSLTEEYFKELALAQAIISSDSDILVEPVYQITKAPIPGKSTTTIEVNVTGYGAKFINPKKLTIADTTMIQFSLKNLQDKPNVKTTEIPNNSVPVTTKTKSYRGGGFIY